MRFENTLLETRAEVAVLNRNVRISSVDDGPWNCNIVVSDFLDFMYVGELPIQRNGNVILDNIEIKECG